MAINLIDTNTTSTITADTAGDAWVVAEGVYVATDSVAIDGYGIAGDKTFHIDGHVVADQGNAIRLGDQISGDGGTNAIFISASGTLGSSGSGFDGHAVISWGGGLTLTNLGTISSAYFAGVVEFGGSASLFNGGTITAKFSGLSASDGVNALTNAGYIFTSEGRPMSAGGDGNTMTNTGELVGFGGMYVSGDDNAVVNHGRVDSAGDADTGALALSLGTGNFFFNTGTVTANAAEGRAVLLETSTGQSNKLINKGVLSSPGTAIESTDGNEQVVNRDSIFGDIELGAGNDILRNDGVVASEVKLGSGADIYRGKGSVDGTVFGEDGSDILRGGGDDDVFDGGDGKDSLFGRAGDDILIGGEGKDTLKGGADDDIFAFVSLSDLGKSATKRDVILDFGRGDDRIDLSDLDAKSGGGNQAFTLIGTNGFSGKKGELRYEKKSDSTIVSGDRDGDGKSDFAIELAGRMDLSEADFFL